MKSGSHGLTEESRTHNRKVANSSFGPAGMRGVNALSPPSIPRRGALEQDTDPPTAPRAPQHKWLPIALGVCSRCVCVHCCVFAFGWVNVKHEFHVWVTMSRHFQFQKPAIYTNSFAQHIFLPFQISYRIRKAFIFNKN